jgi:flavin reductase (DIM6/NTAB) family NADH-FMN oxidoreductase RutF
MMTIAVECRSYSSTLFEQEDEFCLAVPGERLAREVLFCGTHSGRDLDKAKACGLQWEPPHRISTPGVRQAIANLEMRIVNRVPSGDHTLIVAEVLSIAMADNPEERALLSIGPATEGYEVLAESGQHVLGVAARGVRESGLRRDE